MGHGFFCRLKMPPSLLGSSVSGIRVIRDSRHGFVNMISIISAGFCHVTTNLEAFKCVSNILVYY